jgi:hypothetical protein
MTLLMRYGTRSIAAAIVLLVSFASSARADVLQDCERFATVQFRKNGSDITRVEVERPQSPIIDRYDAKVGSQYVSAEVMGFVRLTTPSGVRRQRYLCLHAGEDKGAVYFSLTLE